MNFYKHHIGDYAQATAHLTFVEDAAYSRLIRKYYAEESPLPSDIKQVQRLVGARSKDEREAVETILNEFFTLQEDGWHQARCDEELADAADSQDDRETKKANERERQRRHRERRKQLFEALREHGIVPSYETSTDDLLTQLSRVTKTYESHDVTKPVTRDATANQTPDSISQTPIARHQGKNKPAPAAPAVEIPDWLPGETWQAFIDMRRKIRKPMTDHAAALLIAELGKLMQAGHRPRLVLEQSIMNSWQGVFALKAPRLLNDSMSREAFNERENAKAKELLFGPEDEHAAG